MGARPDPPRDPLRGEPPALDLAASAFEKARRDGKVRWLGISVHNDKVLRRVLTDYPQFSVVLFPCLFLTRPQGGEGLLALAAARHVGVIGIKPFGAGATFGLEPSGIAGSLDARASVLLKAIPADRRLSAVIPGVRDARQLAENVRASYERDKPLNEADHHALRQCEANFHAHATPDYDWLHRWKTV